VDNGPVDILIIIPAYNEGRSLPSVIESLKKHGYNNILVIDDGSGDGTFEIAGDLKVYVARHSLNAGAGCASATGFEIAKILDPHIVVTFDADGQHDAADIARLVGPIQRDEADVVIGSRMLSGSGMPWKRILYNKIANTMTFILYGFSLSDTQSGFKAFNRKAYRLINIETSRMEYCSEIVHKIEKNNLRHTEIKVRTIYTDYSLSKGQGLATGLKTLMRLVLDGISKG
jgi:glycosyltransferase involved in cell wall biosynthesis